MKTAIAMFSGAAALVVAVGFGGPGVSVGGAPTPSHPSSSVTPARGNASVPDGPEHVVLTGCIAGLDC